MWSHATLLLILRRQFQQFQLPMSQHLDQQSFRALVPEDITVVTANHALSFMPRDATMVPCVCSATSVIDLRRKGGRRQRELLSKEVHDADSCRCSPQQDLKRQKLSSSPVDFKYFAMGTLLDPWQEYCTVPIHWTHWTLCLSTVAGNSFPRCMRFFNRI